MYVGVSISMLSEPISIQFHCAWVHLIGFFQNSRMFQVCDNASSRLFQPLHETADYSEKRITLSNRLSNSGRDMQQVVGNDLI